MNAILAIINNQRLFFQSQKTKDLDVRVAYLKKLKSIIKENEQKIFNALNKDFRKSEFESFISEIGLVYSELDLAIKNLKKWSKPKRIKSSILTFPSSDYVYCNPYGTVLIIAPWNYPFLLAIDPLIMAIAAGNTVVLKPSELTPSTSKIITEIIEAVFPRELAVSIEGGIETSQTLLEQKWDYIFFTGSTKVGKIVYESAAKHLTPATLELGGKSPCIIDDTVNIKLISKRLVWGKLLNGGQTCIAPDFVIVKESIKTKLIDALIEEINQQYGKNPKLSEDFPRIINARNFNRLRSLLEEQTIAFGGDIDITENYISPTLVDTPSLESDIMNEEIFGPILPILTYKTHDNIEIIMQHIERPLALYVFSKNKDFVEMILNKYSFGGGVVNDLLIHFGNDRLPFGGIGLSGIGKSHGKHGFNTFTHAKSIMKRGTWFDPPFRYAPYKKKLDLLKKLFKYFG